MKEVHVSPGGDGGGRDGARAQRFAFCHNPDQAQRAAQVRENLVAHLRELIEGSDTWTPRRRDELVGTLKSKPGLRRYLRRTKGGLLRVDAAAIKTEAALDGKWLPRTSDTTLSPDDLAAAYKQLLAVERGWRDIKGALRLRPVFHHREDRIRAHVQLCWLALLLLRVIETAAGDTWRNLRHELDRMAPGHPRHRPRPGRATLRNHTRTANPAPSTRPTRTAPILRLRPRRRLNHRATTPESQST